MPAANSRAYPCEVPIVRGPRLPCGDLAAALWWRFVYGGSIVHIVCAAVYVCRLTEFGLLLRILIVETEIAFVLHVV